MKHASKALVMFATVMLLACLAPCLALAQPSEREGAVTEPALVGGGASEALEAQDTTMFTVGLQVTYGQTEARSMLDSINAFRTGDDAWYWNKDDTEKVYCTGLADLAYDYDLERVAKYRAAEIALSFSHTTLDGMSDARSMITDRTAWGENIAAGQESAAAAFASWQETDWPYFGQGHRRNMLSADFTAVGIGHVVCNGYHYWVQEFGTPISDAAATAADDSASTVNLQIADSVIVTRSATASTGALALSPGDSADLPDVTVKIATADAWNRVLKMYGTPVRVLEDPGITWASSDPSVAKVVDGRVKAVAKGTAILTASVPLGSINSPTVEVVVADSPQPAYAILYENGDLVFQSNSTSEDSRGTVLHTWSDFVRGEKASEDMWSAEDFRMQVKKIVFKDEIAPFGSMARFFYNLENLTSIEGVGKLDTSKVTDMGYMFYNCSSLASLDLSDWDTSKVTDMSWMFEGCSSLSSVGVSGWNTSAVGDMSNMFANCSSLSAFDLSGWKTTNVSNMSFMFANCSSLVSLDLSGWDISNATGMTSMIDVFSGCLLLASVDISGWDLSFMGPIWDFTLMRTMKDLFSGCSSLERIGAAGVKLPANCSKLFAELGTLCEIEGASTWDTSKVTSMSEMFFQCSSLSSLDVSKWDTSKVTSMNSMFFSCSSLSSLDVSKWDTSAVTDMGSMFCSCSKLATLDVSSWNTSGAEKMGYMFNGCSSLASLDVSGWDTSSATSISGMFYGCSSLSSLDVSSWDTSGVEYMGEVFRDCSSLSSLDVSSWDTSSLVYMYNMFRGCSSLSSLDLSDWTISKATNVSNMFNGCSSLAALDVSGWDTSSVTNMDSVFSGCSSLSSLSFGSAFQFVGTNAALPDIAETDAYTGKWERASDKATATSAELMARSDLEGTWTWQKQAQDEPARSGTFGTCDWSIDEAGKLVIEPSNGVSGVLPSNDGQDSEFFPWVKVANLVKSAEIRKSVSLEGSAKRMFGNCSNLKSIDASGFDTSKVTSMELMFASCTSLSSLDLSSWDTSSVTTMRSLFGGCRSLASVNLSGWDASHVIDMEGMFAACASLASLDLSGFDMSANKGIGGMLSECSALSTLKLGESVMLYSPNGVKYAGLPDAPSTSPYTGKWARVSDGMSVTSYELQHRAGAELAGTWVWETESGSSDDPGGSGQGGQQGGEPSGGSGGSVSPGDNPSGSSTDPSGSSVDPGGSGQGGSTPSKPDLKQYEGTAAASGMSDLKAGEWFMDPATGAFPGTSTLYIDYTIARGLMGGYKDGSGRVTAFGPHDPLSRAQTATILYRLAKPDSKATTEPAAYEDNESGLTDVASRQYYTAAVNWCVHEGIITGYRDKDGRYTAFGPDDSVSREQLATMIFRYCTKYAKRDPATADITAFTDYGRISDWARDGVAYCVANKIVGGYTDGSGRFGPQDSAERCQMSKIIAVTAYMLE